MYFPTIIPATALGLHGSVAPSNRVTLATIGVGWMGGSHVDVFLRVPEVQYVALDDVDDPHSAENRAKVEKKYGNSDCIVYRAFEELLSRRPFEYGIVAFNGCDGAVRRIEVGLPGGWSDFNNAKDQTRITEPPPGVN